MKKLNIAIVGYGGMGAYHSVAFLKDNNKFNVYGVFDIDKSRYKTAEENGITRFYESAQSLASDKQIDAVLIATPNDSHFEYVKYFACSGKHVICEKPVALSSKEYSEMLEVCRRNNVVFIVHQNRRWDPDFLTVKKIYEQSVLGKIYKIESRVQGGNGIPGDWRKFPEKGGGMMLDWGVHLIDQAICLLGVPESVYCVYSYSLGFEVDDGFKLELRYSNGLIYEIVVDTSCFIPLPRWSIYGNDGTAQITDWELNGKIVKPVYSKDYKIAGIKAGNGFTKTMAYRAAESVTECALDKVYPESNAFYNDFYIAVTDGREPFIKSEEVMSVMKIMEKAKLSSELNKVIKMEE